MSSASHPACPGAQLEEIEGDEYRGSVKVKVGPDHGQLQGQGHVRREGRERAPGGVEGRGPRCPPGKCQRHHHRSAGAGGQRHQGQRQDRSGGDRQGGPVRPGCHGRGEREAAQPVRAEPRDEGPVPGGARRCPGSPGAAAADNPAPASPAPGRSAPPSPGAAAPAATGSSAPSSAVPASSAAPSTPSSAAPSTTSSVPGAGSAAGGSTPANNGAPSTPTVRKITPTEPVEPVDLLGATGAPLAKRVAPVVGALVVLLIVSRWLRRRRG